MRAATLGLAAITLLACNREQPHVTADPVDAARPQPSASAPAKPAPVTAVACTADKECGFDDDCFATACVGRKSMVGCDESAPHPGTCVCASDVCTLLRKDPKTGAAKTGCKADFECGFEAATGRCVAGTRTSIISERGAFCTCSSAGTCSPHIVERVPCLSDSDCSWLDDPFRPAPAAKVPRPFPPSKPCTHGSHDSTCRKETCVVTVWKC